MDPIIYNYYPSTVHWQISRVGIHVGVGVRVGVQLSRPDFLHL